MKHTRIVLNEFPSSLRHWAQILEEKGKLQISWYCFDIVLVNPKFEEAKDVTSDKDFWACSHCNTHNKGRNDCIVCGYNIDGKFYPLSKV